MSGTTHRWLAVAAVSISHGLTFVPIDVIASSRALGLVAHTLSLTMLSIGAISGASVPDIDLRYLRHHPWVGHVLQHRVQTHSILGVAAVAAPLAGLIAAIGFPGYAAAFLIGWITHVIADCLTPAGVALLWPWKRRLRLLPRRVCFGAAAEPILRHVAVLVTAGAQVVPYLLCYWNDATRCLDPLWH